MEMYLYINEHQIEKYNGEPLKIYVGSKLVRVIVNPTEEDLRIFGYKSLIAEEQPEEKEGYYIDTYYEDGDTSLIKKYRYVEIPAEEISEEV